MATCEIGSGGVKTAAKTRIPIITSLRLFRELNKEPKPVKVEYKFYNTNF